MKVKLLVDRDNCKAGEVVSYGDRSARAVIASKQAVAWEDPPAEKKTAKPKTRKPEPAVAPVEEEN